MSDVKDEVGETPLGFQPLVQDDQADFIEMPPAHSRRRGWLIALILILLIALIGGGLAYAFYARKPKVQFTQQTIHTGNLTMAVSATGPVVPKVESAMNFTTAGQVNAIDVQVGQQVQAGQTLATLNATVLQDQVAAAQQKVTAAQIAYSDAYNIGASQSVLDQDNQNILAAQAALKIAQDNLAAATLTAPENATVAAINGAVGESVGSGSGNNAASQPFIVLTNTSTLMIAAQVNEADIAQVKSGQTASFTVPSYPSNTFQASVTTIETVGQTTSNVVNYTVDLTVNQSSLNGANLYPGMTATVNIITAKQTKVVLVPVAALSFASTAVESGELNRSAITSLFANAPTATKGTRGVVLELRNGKLTPVLVTTGLSNGQNTAILSGLSAGDSVVVGQTGGTTLNSSLNGTNTVLPKKGQKRAKPAAKG